MCRPRGSPWAHRHQGAHAQPDRRAVDPRLRHAAGPRPRWPPPTVSSDCRSSICSSGSVRTSRADNPRLVYVDVTGPDEYRSSAEGAGVLARSTARADQTAGEGHDARPATTCRAEPSHGSFCVKGARNDVKLATIMRKSIEELKRTAIVGDLVCESGHRAWASYCASNSAGGMSRAGRGAGVC
jgi:hypothetical protein